MKKKQEIFEEDENWFEDDGMETIEMVETMTAFLKMQHHGALELTKLTLEHCKLENLTTEGVFNIFQDAMTVMQKNIKSPIE